MAITAAEVLVKIGVEDNLSKGLDSFSGKLNAFGASALKIGGALTLGITAPILGIGTSAITAAGEIDALKRGLAVVAGSSGQAEAQFRRLREVAKLPGLGLEEAVRTSINLQAAGMSANLAERALMGFGNALAAVGKGRVELDGVALALTQISSSTKISAQDLKQLTDRVPQLKGVMQDLFGATTAEGLNAKGVTPQMFIEGIIGALEKLPKVTGGFKNDLENLKDTWKIALADMGNAMLPFASKAAELGSTILTGLANGFTSLSPTMQNVVLGIGALGALTGPALIGLGSMATGCFRWPFFGRFGVASVEGKLPFYWYLSADQQAVFDRNWPAVAAGDNGWWVRTSFTGNLRDRRSSRNVPRASS